jgi:formate dehydrogenase major subunit
MIREKITDPWREVSWEEAMEFAATRMRGIQAQVRAESVGVITSSRCTNEETFLVQKLTRAALATTTPTPAPASAIRRPAMVWDQTFGTSAGTQDFDSVEQTDVVIVIGANPTDGHPVFASR